MNQTAAKPFALVLIALVVLPSAGACRDGNDADPPLVPAPVRSGVPEPMVAAPIQSTSPGSPAGLPADHPPVPGLEQAAGPAGEPTGLPVDHPPIEASNPVVPELLAEPRMEGALQWSTPDSWVEEAPSSTMRLAQWRLGAQGADEGVECALLRFSGGGGIEDNLARWIGQFSQPDGSTTADHARRDQILINDLAITTLELTGTLLARNPPMVGPVVEIPGQAMYGAIIETREGPYFLKCTGPEATMAAERGGILSFLLGLRM